MFQQNYKIVRLFAISFYAREERGGMGERKPIYFASFHNFNLKFEGSGPVPSMVLVMCFKTDQIAVKVNLINKKLVLVAVHN